jgi:hypothetical protein
LVQIKRMFYKQIEKTKGASKNGKNVL